MSQGHVPFELQAWMAERLGPEWEAAWRLNDDPGFYSVYLDLEDIEPTDGVRLADTLLEARLCEGEWAYPDGAIPDRVIWEGAVTFAFAKQLERIIPLRWYADVDGRARWRRPSWAGVRL